MALNAYEKDTLAEIKARVLANQPVSAYEKQLVLDLYRRSRQPVAAAVLQLAARKGFDTTGITGF